MIETPYSMLLATEMLNAQLSFAQNILDIDEEAACEASTNKDYTTNDFIHASINFIVAKTIEAIRLGIREFINQLKTNIKQWFTNILIPLGMHDEKCVDKHNICEFISMESSRIRSIQDTITREIKLARKTAGLDKHYSKRYLELDTKVKMLAADFQRWKKHGKSVVVDVTTIKIQLRIIESLISQLNECEGDLTVLESFVRTGKKLDNSVLDQIKQLSTIITYAINAYSLIINTLNTSISPVSKIKEAAKTATKSLNPNNWYDDDVDLKVLLN